VRRFKKAIIEHALGDELPHHLGYPLGGEKPDDTTNHRNGSGSNTVLTDDGPLPIDVSRDRGDTFDLIGKHERRFYRTRRQGHRAVCPWPDRPRDAGRRGGGR